MGNIAKKIEVGANVAIIVVALLLVALLVRGYLLPKTPKFAPVANAQIRRGTKLSIPGADLSQSQRILLMVLSTTCHFCTESAPFYQRIAAGHGATRLVAIMPQPVGEAQNYLSQHGISVDEVRQVNLDAIGVRGTPTLILLDGTSSVLETWDGKLPPERESEVLARL